MSCWLQIFFLFEINPTDKMEDFFVLLPGLILPSPLQRQPLFWSWCVCLPSVFVYFYYIRIKRRYSSCVCFVKKYIKNVHVNHIHVNVHDINSENHFLLSTLYFWNLSVLIHANHVHSFYGPYDIHSTNVQQFAILLCVSVSSSYHDFLCLSPPLLLSDWVL